MLQGYMKNLVVILFALGTYFFLMVFLMGNAHNLKTHNAVQNMASMQQADVFQWGRIPGSLGYDWKRTFEIYSF
jgi:preprotein translocase subunit SecG